MMSFKQHVKRLIVMSIALQLAACSGNQPKTIAVEKEIKSIVDQQKKPAVPDDVTNALLNTHHLSKKQEVIEDRFNISVNQIPARTFFLSLVADSGINVVAHPEISGAISLELKNVTLDEVLNVTREVYGYEYKKTKGIYTIYPRKLRTEVFPIDYLDVQRVGVTDTSVLIGEISSGGSGSNSGSSSSSNNNQNNSSSGGGNSGGGGSLLSYLEGVNGSGGTVSRGTRVQTLSKTDFWTGLNKAVLEIIGGGVEGRFVMTNPQAGLIVVKAMPGELNAVRDFLEKSELSAKRQVVLETKILEVTLNDGYESGINWGAIGGQLSMQEVRSGASSLDNILTGNGGDIEAFSSSIINVVDITRLLFLLEQQGSVQVLSSPRVSTVNNQKAVIRVGADEFFVTGITNSTTTSGDNTVNAPEIELESFFSGISLDVTPQISESGEVILHIHPLVSTVQDQLKTINVGREAYSLPLALREVRESDSIVKAKNGQVVILGGLMQEVTDKTNTKRPFLGDIPVLNTLFKSKQNAKRKTELVILMRPIVVEDETWSQMIDDQATRINNISDMYRSR